MKVRYTSLSLALLAGFFAADTRGQSQPPTRPPQQRPQSAPSGQEPAAPPAQNSPASQQGANPAQGTAAQDDNPKRILGIIPNFETTNDRPRLYEPITPGEKYIIALHQMFDISAHVGNAFQAGIQQAANGQPHYGQGWGAYGQRFAAAEGDQFSSAFFIYGGLPVLLKEDPRYFRRGSGSPMGRIWYGVSRTFVIRRDSGTNTFNTPQILGQMLQASISNAYYPAQDRTVGGTFLNWGINLAYNSGYNVVKEFYPDFLVHVLHRRPKTAPAADPQPAKNNSN